jgi:hypothetical protein
VQDRLQRLARLLDAFVLEVQLGHPLLGLGDVLDPVGERVGVLRLGLEDRVVEHLAGLSNTRPKTSGRTGP